VAPAYGIGISSKQARTLADDATRKALQLDSSSAEGHTARAMYLCQAWKWNEAEQEFRRALELNPNSASAHYFYAMEFLLSGNRLDQSLAELHIAMSLDPLSPIVNTNYAMTLMAAHRYDDSLAQFQKTLQADPGFAPAHYKLSVLYAVQGHFAEANEELQKYHPTPGNFSPDAKGYVALTLAMTPKEEWMSTEAAAYGNVGDKENAIGYLEKAYEGADEELLMAIRFPSFDGIRSDPRYKDMMRRIGLPE
jgi:tetratricopeptide (TPR) repeat protein